MRDPYSIYARYILDLEALEPLEREPGAAERGQIMHKILEKFVYDHCLNGVPDNAYDLLIACGREEFSSMDLSDELYVFWWPRFERMARDFIRHETKWQQSASPLIIEAMGKANFDAPYGPFTLTARVDRIDVMKDGGTAAIIDYKTGEPPKSVDVIDGFAPQLPLEALLVATTAFAQLKHTKSSALAFWKVSGGYPPFDPKPLKPEDVLSSIQNAEIGFPELIAAFDREETPYYAVPYLDKAPSYNDYAHLERLSEWGYVEKL